MGRRVVLGLLVFVIVALGCGSAFAQQVGKPTCQSGDMIETGLQGQVPQADRASGRAAQGYNCNLELIGEYPTKAFISLDTYGNCAYFSDTEGGVDTGTLVIDASDPRHPRKTDYLTVPAMGNSWESMKVDPIRGLLVADHPNQDDLAVYDVKSDCRHPKLLSSTHIVDAPGHEGFFAPDGRTYYMSGYGNQTTAVDLDDPTHPRQLMQCVVAFCQIHGGSISADGTRGYFAQVNAPDGLAIVDTSEVQARKPNPQIKSISTLPFPWNSANQATIPVFYGTHPYLMSFGELTINPALTTTPAPFSPHCPVNEVTNFDFPRIIDIGDERNPSIVSKLMIEVDDPANCPLVVGDNTAPPVGTLAGNDAQTKLLLSVLFGYDNHYCSVDRLHDPTLLACAQSLSGVRVFDVRDPRHPRELAYYNPGTVSATDPTVDGVGARPIIRSDLGQIWMISLSTGFKVLQFENGVWPFKDTPACPAERDDNLLHYDLGYAERCGIGNATAIVKRVCTSRRSVRIRLPHTAVSARVRVNGKLATILRGKRLRNRIDLRGLPKGIVKVDVAARLRNGRTVHVRRNYRTCVPQQRRA